MAKRKVLEVPGVSHTAPIPMGVRVGNMVFSSAIMGRDPSTNELPDDPAEQTALTFRNLRTLLESAGATPDDLAHVSVYITDDSVREHVNRHWLEMFPDEDDRPARHTTVMDLPRGMAVQIEVIAVV